MACGSDVHYSIYLAAASQAAAVNSRNARITTILKHISLISHSYSPKKHRITQLARTTRRRPTQYGYTYCTRGTVAVRR